MLSCGGNITVCITVRSVEPHVINICLYVPSPYTDCKAPNLFIDSSTLRLAVVCLVCDLGLCMSSFGYPSRLIQDIIASRICFVSAPRYSNTLTDTHMRLDRYFALK